MMDVRADNMGEESRQAREEVLRTYGAEGVEVFMRGWKLGVAQVLEDWADQLSKPPPRTSVSPPTPPYMMPRMNKDLRQERFRDWLRTLQAGEVCGAMHFVRWVNAQGVHTAYETVYPMFKTATDLEWLKKKSHGVYERTDRLVP